MNALDNKMAMPSESEIMKALSRVIDPELHRNIVELGMVRGLTVHEGVVKFTLALTIPGCPLRDKLAADARAAVNALPGVEKVIVTLGEMSAAERAAALGRVQPKQFRTNQLNRVGQVVAVMSGKGGVGKSSVTALLALALARQGYKVGILDADVTGPSIPKLFGLKFGEVQGDAAGLLPVVAAEGIKVMSMNLLLSDEDAPVIWRGPLIHNTIQQFWTDVSWGKLDYLLVDLPPGTSDAALTVMQSLPVNGVIVVTTPQDLAAMVVRKAVRMAERLNVPVLGIVENMSYFECPETGKRHEIFGPSHAEEMAVAAGAPILARLPIDPLLVQLSDQGWIAAYQGASVAELGQAFEARAPVASPEQVINSMNRSQEARYDYREEEQK